MKRCCVFLCTFLIILSLITPVFATEQGEVIHYEETDLGNDIVVISKIVEYPNARLLGKAAERTDKFYDDGVLIGVITLYATFQYDGSTVSVIYKSVSQADTYEGWSFKQNSLTSSGGTVTLNAKLTKLLVFNIPFTMTLSCDKDGNLS